MASASEMVWPVTNCSPISFMARCTPWRISGSPPLPISRVSDEVRLFSLLVEVILPVSIRPQTAALTNIDGEWPRCACQSPWLILSRISASRVALSGMRSSASARHISATPSWLESENSCTSASTPPVSFLLRRPSTNRVASDSMAWRCTASGVCASCTSTGRHSGSGRCQAAVMAARRSLCGSTFCAQSRKGWGALVCGGACSVSSSTLSAAAALAALDGKGTPRSMLST